MKASSKTSRRIALRVLAWALVGLPLGTQAQLLAFPDVPLFVSTSVTPNVMLLTDNSGSMNNIIWDSDYDPLTTYPNYSPNTCGNGNQPCWPAGSGNVIRRTDGDANGNNLPSNTQGVAGERGGCSKNFREGRLNGNGTRRCLRLPDPVGNGNTRFAANYLNYLFHTKVGNSGAVDLRTAIPVDYRLQVQKDVATSIVTNNPGLRFGLSSFNSPVSGDSGPGGSVRAACGASRNSVLSAIADLNSDSNTPLAETYYEVTRYFRGLSRQFSSGSHTSPIQYRCQKNFVIAITDGLPTYDRSFPQNDPDDSDGRLPNWDGQSPATSAAQFPNFPRYSDGFGPSGAEGDEGYSLYLDDMAKFGFDIDLVKTGTDLAGVSYNAADFPQQNLVTYTVGFSTSNQMLEDAAEYGDGQYFTADNAEQLQTALQTALTDILARTSSAASVALNSGFLDAGTQVYQARFNTSDWSGELLSFPISNGSTPNCTNVPVGELCPLKWNAGTRLTAQGTSRNIITTNYDTRGGAAFRWGNIGAWAQARLNRAPSGTADDNQGQLRISYLRGGRGNEALAANPRFRARTTLLGDIVNSDPFFVGQPPFAYNFGNYAAFRSSNAARRQVVYIGANDGMLHGFDADTGDEVIAYVPSKAFGTLTNPKLSKLTNPEYGHEFIVDGSPTVGDVQVGLGNSTTWRSILVGGMRSGGQGVYALNVTNPQNFNEANAASLALWEFTDRDDPDLGYTFSQPAVVKMANGRWAAVMGNGYNNTEADGNASATGQASLFILFTDGPPVGSGGAWTADTDYRKLTVPGGSVQTPNGLASAAPVDVDGDNVIDYIYAGDLQGNLWRFDVTDENPDLWTSTSIFVARDAAGNRQSITTSPEVGFNRLRSAPETDPVALAVYFGTGRYLDQADNQNVGQQTQTFYGVFDSPTEPLPNVATTRANMLRQSVFREVNVAGSACGANQQTDRCFRLSTDEAIVLGTHRGWYMDLFNSNNGAVSDAQAAAGLNQGERQVSTPILRQGRIIFTTLITSNDPCGFGGGGWLMELDAISGARLPASPFDSNGDGDIDDEDIIEVTVDGETVRIPPSGLRSQVGILPRPTVLNINNTLEIKYAGGSTGEIAAIRESPGGRLGRVTWRELIAQ